MKTNNINMSCTHEGVSINFSYYEGASEISVNMSSTKKGYTTSRNDRYGLDGTRLFAVEDYKGEFTEAFFAHVDETARLLAAFINDENN